MIDCWSSSIAGLKEPVRIVGDFWNFVDLMLRRWKDPAMAALKVLGSEVGCESTTWFVKDLSALC